MKGRSRVPLKRHFQVFFQTWQKVKNSVSLEIRLLRSHGQLQGSEKPRIPPNSVPPLSLLYVPFFLIGLFTPCSITE